MLWIERKSLLKWMEEAGQWTSFARAVSQLGISRESMEALGVSGTVRYSLEPIPGCMHGWKFSKEDIKQISTKFEESDVPVLPYRKGGQLISLCHAVKDLVGAQRGLTTVVQGVISGKLKPHGRAGKFKGILDYLFLKAEIVGFQSGSDGHDDTQFIGMQEVIRLLQVNEDVLRALIREGFLKAAENFEDWIVRIFSLSDVLSFQAKYVSAKVLAKQEATSPAAIKRILCRRNVPYIAVYGSPDKKSCFFERSSLEVAGLFKSIQGECHV